jgi:hypothetical protein
MRKLLLLASSAVIGLPSVAAAQAGGQEPSSAGVGSAPAASSYGVESAYTGASLDARETRISNRIRAGDGTGALSRSEASRDFESLSRIRLYQHQHSRPNGFISSDTQAQVSRQLDSLEGAITSQSK